MRNPRGVSMPDRASIIDRGCMKTQINFPLPLPLVRMRAEGDARRSRFAHAVKSNGRPVLISNEIHFIRRARIRGAVYVHYGRRWAPRETRSDRLPARGPRAAEPQACERNVITLMVYRKTRRSRSVGNVGAPARVSLLKILRINCARVYGAFICARRVR